MRHKTPKTAFTCYLLLLLLLVLFMCNLVYWQSHNVNYFNYDSLRHHIRSLEIFDSYGHGIKELLLKTVRYPSWHPPLVYVVVSLFYFVTTPTQANVVLINTVLSLAVLLFSVYNLGKIIKDEKLGILSCVIILLYPVVFNQAKIYMLDLPLASVVSLNIYLLIKSDFFRNKKHLLLYVMSSLAGMLIKITFPVYTIGPLICTAYIAIKTKKISLLRPLAAILALLVSILLCLYGATFFGKSIFFNIVILKFTNMVTTNTPQNLIEVPFLITKIRSLLWYIWGFINWQAGFLFFMLFVGGLHAFIKSKMGYKHLIIAWLASSYFLLAWFISGIDIDMEVTAIRYSMPLLTPIALISAYGLLSVRRVWLRRGAIISVILCGVLNMALLSYPILKTPFVSRISIAQDKYHLLPSYVTIYSTQPLVISGSNWGSRWTNKSLIYEEIENVFFFIDKFYRGKKIEVMLLSDAPDWWHLRYLSFMYNKNIIFFCDYRNMLLLRLSHFKDIPSFEPGFVLIPKNAFTELYLLSWEKKFKKLFSENKADFDLIRETQFSKLYKRKP